MNAVTDLLTSGPALFPGWVSLLFALGLALCIAHHLPCLVFGRGKRWFHAGHTAMALSMIYMYLSMSYDWNWLPATWQMWFFVVTSAAVAAWILIKLAQGRPVNLLWVLLLIQQASMAYMWYPMMRWNAVVIFILVSWFAIETFGWAAGLLPDDVRILHNHNWFPHEIGGAERVTAHPNANNVDRRDPRDCDRHTSGYLVSSGWKDRVLMAVMALSMGYMFYGMELMR